MKILFRNNTGGNLINNPSNPYFTWVIHPTIPFLFLTVDNVIGTQAEVFDGIYSVRLVMILFTFQILSFFEILGRTNIMPKAHLVYGPFGLIFDYICEEHCSQKLFCNHVSLKIHMFVVTYLQHIHSDDQSFCVLSMCWSLVLYLIRIHRYSSLCSHIYPERYRNHIYIHAIYFISSSAEKQQLCYDGIIYKLILPIIWGIKRHRQQETYFKEDCECLAFYESEDGIYIVVIISTGFMAYHHHNNVRG